LKFYQDFKLDLDSEANDFLSSKKTILNKNVYRYIMQTPFKHHRKKQPYCTYLRCMVKSVDLC